MATYRVYKRRDGMISVTAVVRKKGHGAIIETFVEATKSKAMTEAKAWAAETERSIYLLEKNSPRAAKQRLADFFDEYFAHLELTQRKRQSTIDYERRSRKQIERLIGADTMMTDIHTHTITAFRDQRIREGIGASKIRSEIALLSCLWKFAIQERGYNLENPVGPGKLWRPPAPKEKTDFLSELDIKALMTACRASRSKKLAAYVTVLINTGMRPGEAATLKVSDVDQEKRSIVLARTKNDDSRYIPLTESAWKEIEPLVVNRHPDELVFHKGKEMAKAWKESPAQLFRLPFDRAKKIAGLDRITRHGLRHTAATHMLKAGVHLRTIAAVLGHRTLAMVMKYTHPDEVELKKAVDTLDRLI